MIELMEQIIKLDWKTHLEKPEQKKEEGGINNGNNT